MSNRHQGIGCDQILVLEKCKKTSNFYCRIFNNNGREVMQCGNGLICLTIFLKEKRLLINKHATINTQKRNLKVKIIKNNRVQVNMGKIDFYYQSELPLKNKESTYEFKNKEENRIKLDLISIGNPHCIIYVNNIDKVSLKSLNNKIKSNKIFIEKFNINFVEILNKNHILLKIYERDVGQTLSCGSGACASVAIGILNGDLDKRVKVEFSHGMLYVFWDGKINKPIYLTGLASYVYDGVYCKKYNT